MTYKTSLTTKDARKYQPFHPAIRSFHRRNKIVFKSIPHRYSIVIVGYLIFAFPKIKSKNDCKQKALALADYEL